MIREELNQAPIIESDRKQLLLESEGLYKRLSDLRYEHITDAELFERLRLVEFKAMARHLRRLNKWDIYADRWWKYD